MKDAAKAVGRGISKAAKSVWNFGKKGISYIPKVFSKIAHFFGKKK